MSLSFKVLRTLTGLQNRELQARFDIISSITELNNTSHDEPASVCACSSAPLLFALNDITGISQNTAHTKSSYRTTKFNFNVKAIINMIRCAYGRTVLVPVIAEHHGKTFLVSTVMATRCPPRGSGPGIICVLNFVDDISGSFIVAYLQRC